MSRLRNRLGRLSHPGPTPGEASGGDEAGAPEGEGERDAEASAERRSRQLDRLTRRERRRGRARATAPRAEELPGETWWTEAGEFQLIEHRAGSEARHGHMPVTPARRIAGERVATIALDPVFRDVDLSRALFIDTETTGLAGGAGTIPFLIGIARWDGDSLHVEKLLLRRLGEERPMLTHLASRIAEASCVISYNGKSFDWPLLRTRYVMNRVPRDLPRLSTRRRSLTAREGGGAQPP